MTVPVPDLPDTEPALWPVPAWITDPDARESIALGLYDLPDSLIGDSA